MKDKNLLKENDSLRDANERIAAAAKQVFVAWDNWREADGWDNEEYDLLSSAMNSLGKLVVGGR